VSVIPYNFPTACEGKAIPVEPWTDPESSRSFRPPDFKIIDTWNDMVVSPNHRPPLSQFLLEAESTPGPKCGMRDYATKNSNNTIGNRTRVLPGCSAVPQSTMPPGGALPHLHSWPWPPLSSVSTFLHAALSSPSEQKLKSVNTFPQLVT